MQTKSMKVYVSVLAAFDREGRIYPRKIRWEDGQVYTVDRVYDVRPAPALKAGGQGDAYTISVQGQRSRLFFERSTDPASAVIGRWFVERRG